MAKKAKITRNGTLVYPVTVSDAVYDQYTARPVSDTLYAHESKIKELSASRQEICDKTLLLPWHLRARIKDRRLQIQVAPTTADGDHRDGDPLNPSPSYMSVGLTPVLLHRVHEERGGSTWRVCGNSKTDGILYLQDNGAIGDNSTWHNLSWHNPYDPENRFEGAHQGIGVNFLSGNTKKKGYFTLGWRGQGSPLTVSIASPEKAVLTLQTRKKVFGVALAASFGRFPHGVKYQLMSNVVEITARLRLAFPVGRLSDDSTKYFLLEKGKDSPVIPYSPDGQIFRAYVNPDLYDNMDKEYWWNYPVTLTVGA